MKKIKSTEKKFITAHYYKLIFFNLLSFFIIFVLLGLLSISLIDRVFFSDIKNDIDDTGDAINANMEYSPEIDRIIVKNIKNARVLMIFYDDTGQVRYYTNSFLSYLIEDYDKYGNITTFDSPFGGRGEYTQELLEEYIAKVSEAEKHQIFTFDTSSVGKYQMFETIENGDEKYSFLTKTLYIENDSVPIIRYAKIMIMVNGEINSRDQIVKVYIACATLMILFGAVASIILSMNATKPIVEALNKQMAFVSDASHELKTPLAIVQSKLENTLTKSDKTVYEVSEDIAVSLKEITRLSKLTTELLELARSDSSKDKLILEETDICELVVEASSIFKELAELQEKEFILELDDVISLVDKNKIKQLLIILLDNALRYTNETDSILIKLKASTNEFVVSVIDTGIGITDETKNKMFERFYREDKARSRETGGNGLGLAIAKTIVNNHGGKIYAEHNEPKGTKIIFSISRNLKSK